MTIIENMNYQLELRRATERRMSAFDRYRYRQAQAVNNHRLSYEIRQKYKRSATVAH